MSRILIVALGLGLCLPQVDAQSRARATKKGGPARKAAAAADPVGLTPAMRIVANHIHADSLKGHVSFLASDLLEGRDTPSRGLDIAGEYIASNFRRMGLEPAGDDGYFQTVVIKPEEPLSAKSRNVVGILRGSDPKLKDTYVVVSSHYDHIGLAATGDDKIFNGANDDASGTASALEVASALASLHPRPRRSIVFILFCGEEKGLRGSRYYGAHPVVPLAQTVAGLNLEQMGRTDIPGGSNAGILNVTGFDYSDTVQTLITAGKRAGIKVLKDEKASDPFFLRSDNASLARAGIPAHTMSVAYDFPDYHAVGDEWQKLHYDNMEKVDQAVGIAVLQLANAAVGPKWNEANATTKPFVDAAKKLHEGE